MNDPPEGNRPTFDEVTEAQERARPVDTIGPYRLLQPIGAGGMGEVWLAEQTRPVRRQVALKVIKAGMDTKQVVARFEAERQALAAMSHPAIAQVFDAGATPQGRPYFAMEYVRGEAVTAYCNRHRLSTLQRIELFLQVCDGVHHAHQKGIIHRDLKPSNILVTERDGLPAPKIIDFGLAKATTHHLTERTLFTELGVLIGTPEYMSPEQAEMTGLDIDTRTDVYALGVILYELLTGLLPFDATALREKGLDEFRRTIREVEPPRPSTRVTRLAATTKPAQSRGMDAGDLARQLRGDLDWITLRALEKDRTRRYGSVSDLAEDLRRHLNDLPVLARPPSTTYRTGKFVRRHRLGVSVAATLLALLVAFAVTTGIQAQRIARERDRANREAESAKAVNDFLQNDLLAQASARTQARPDIKPDPDLKVRTAVDRAAARIEGKFGTQPLVEASIRQTIGQTYSDLGLYPEAQRHMERALELRRRVLGPEHRDTLWSIGRLADVQSSRGKYTEAETLDTTLLETQRRALGGDHADTLRTMGDLAGVYLSAGKYAQAEALGRQTLDGQKRVLGQDHSDTLMTKGTLAATYREQGKFGPAETLFTEVLESRRRLLGPEHPETLSAMGGLAALYSNQGKYAQAETIKAEIVEIDRRVQGPEHPETLTATSDLVAEYINERKYAQAERLDKQIAEIESRVFGPEHPETLTTINNLAVAYSMQRKYLEAEALDAQLLAIRRRVLGPEHPMTVASMANLALDYLNLGKYAQAETMNRQVLEARRRVLGPEHAGTLRTAYYLALTTYSEGKYAEAEALLRQDLAIYERTMPESWERFRCQSLLGATLTARQKYTEAEPLLLDGVQGMLQRESTIAWFGESDPVRARGYLVRLYQAWGKPAKAAEWQKKIAADR